MKPDALSAAEPEKLKVIYGWYIYVIYILLVFNIYMAVYNVCVRHPLEAPLLSLFHSLFLALMLQQVLKRTSFSPDLAELFYSDAPVLRQCAAC